jgi:hypothetical protein
VGFGSVIIHARKYKKPWPAEGARSNNPDVLNFPLNVPAEKLRTLNAIADALQNVSNVVAVVLGGSYARGLARPDSDIDIGIYYREAFPFSVAQVRSVAERFCTVGSVPIVTGTYEWGLWVNGGAWIQTPVGKVDFLYRNLDQVQRVVEEGRQGIWHHDYDQQPPYGFRSVVYFGETFICVPLHDQEGEIARLKKSVSEYPAPLKDTGMGFAVVQAWGVSCPQFPTGRFRTPALWISNCTTTDHAA